MNRKTIFYWLVVLSVIIILVGSLFKVMHWPYSRMVLLIGYCFLFIIYPKYYLTTKINNRFNFLSVIGVLVWAGFKIVNMVCFDDVLFVKAISFSGLLLFGAISFYKYMGFENYQSTRMERIIAIFFLLGEFILAIGLLFKVLHWPYSLIIIVLGLSILAVSFVSTLFTEN